MSTEAGQALLANQKYCHGCAKPIHVQAPACPSCGAPQGSSAMVPANGAIVPANQQMGGPYLVPGGQAIRATSDQKFCQKCGNVMHESAGACPKCGAAQMVVARTTKSRTTAGALALLLGGLGFHHFYLGNTMRGVLYLIFCWTWIPAIVAFFEGIVLLTKSDAEFAAKYAGR